MESNNTAVGELLFSLPPQKKILHYVQYDSGTPAKYRGSRFRSPLESESESHSKFLQNLLRFSRHDSRIIKGNNIAVDPMLTLFANLSS